MAKSDKSRGTVVFCCRSAVTETREASGVQCTALVSNEKLNSSAPLGWDMVFMLGHGSRNCGLGMGRKAVPCEVPG